MSGVFTLHEGGELAPTRGLGSPDMTVGMVYGLVSTLGLIAGVFYTRRRRKHQRRSFDAEVEEREPDDDPPREVWSGRLLLPFGAVAAAVVIGADLDVSLIAVYGIFLIVGWASDTLGENATGWRLFFWFALVVTYFIGLFAVAGGGLREPVLAWAAMHLGASIMATFIFMSQMGGGGGGGTYSSSSWSSSSFSSSSFSSGGFSGGGGSFGGGGASGSW